jgi:hypothetical protein
METDAVGAGVGAGADEMDHEGEDEDFVVREIDVYFTPKPFDEDTMVKCSTLADSVPVRCAVGLGFCMLLLVLA